MEDLRRIVFIAEQDNNMDIYSINADGSDLTRLTNDPETDTWPTWSPDGQQIAFISYRAGISNIYVMNTDGSDLEQLTNIENDLASSPAWSPDGEQIAFLFVDRLGGYDIYVMDSDGRNMKPLVEGLDHAVYKDYWHILPPRRFDWSPSGDQFAVMSGHADDVFDIYTVDVDSGDITRLTDNPAHDWLPAWSPDGQFIAFFSDRDGDSYDVFIMNSDGSEQTHLAKGVANDSPWFLSPPAWSPDSRQVAFVSDRDGEYHIYVMNVDGSNQTRITQTSGVYEHLIWSPTGIQIAFTSRPEENKFAIYVINADGSGLMRLTYDIHARLPSWSLP